MRSKKTIISQGLLKKNDDSEKEYQIIHGWDMKLSQDCDSQWNEHNLKFFQYIDNHFDDEKLDEILQSMQLEDSHWNWFKKSIHCREEGYEWFYLLTGDRIEASCLVYQPKKSAMCKNNIFYIEFIAVAPWNRKTLITEKEYKGVGTILISKILNFLVETLSLIPGFSLHSLPQASGYYEKLGMVNCVSEDKEKLKYYEIFEDKATLLMRSIL